MARALGARAQLGLGFEDSYGMPPAAGNYWQMPFASSTLGSEQPLLESELLGYGRDPLAPALDAVTASGDVQIPLDLRFLGIWLKALFGEPVTTGDAETGFAHEFHSGGYDLPSMAIETGNPDVPSYRMMTGVKASRITWQMQRSGQVTATVSCEAQGERFATASETGALAGMALQRFGAFSGAITRNGQPLGNVVSGSVTYDNRLERVETIRPDGLIEGADEGVASLSGDVTLRFADTRLFDQATKGESCELSFGYAAGDAGSFGLTAHAVYLPRPRISLEGPAGLQVTFSWQAATDPATGRMATVRLMNDVAGYKSPV